MPCSGAVTDKMLTRPGEKGHPTLRCNTPNISSIPIFEITIGLQWLQEKEERDKVRWGENEKKQAEHKHLLDGLYKKMDDMQTELKALMAENTQTHSAEISKVNQSILTLAAQIAEFVKAMTNQPGLITS